MSRVEARSQIDTEGVYGASLSAEAILSLGSMEGVYDPVVSAKPIAVPWTRSELLPGYFAAGAVAVFAYVIQYLPFAPFTLADASGVRHPVSAAIVAILGGLLIRNTVALPDTLRAGCKHAIKKVIPVAIVLTGAGLNLAHVASIGVAALAVVALCISVGMLAGYYGGRAAGLSSKTALLIGTGTAICGNSAIAAVAPLIDAEDDDLVVSITTVNLFGLLAMLIWPVLGSALHLGDQMFGVWTGTSIHAVPQVVAAGFAFSPDAGTLATLVKLVRVTMLAPLVVILGVVYARRRVSQTATPERLTVRYARLVPWFVWGFVAFAVLNTFGLLPLLQFNVAQFLFSDESGGLVSISLVALMTGAGKVLLALAMAAIGLEVDLRVLTGVGKRALHAGLLSTAALGIASLALVSTLL